MLFLSFSILSDECSMSPILGNLHALFIVSLFPSYLLLLTFAPFWQLLHVLTQCTLSLVENLHDVVEFSLREGPPVLQKSKWVVKLAPQQVQLKQFLHQLLIYLRYHFLQFQMMWLPANRQINWVLLDFLQPQLIQVFLAVLVEQNLHLELLIDYVALLHCGEEFSGGQFSPKGSMQEGSDSLVFALMHSNTTQGTYKQRASLDSLQLALVRVKISKTIEQHGFVIFANPTSQVPGMQLCHL